MRGKLRDKRAAEKRDYYKREAIEKRRPGKRSLPAKPRYEEEEEYDELEDYDLEAEEAEEQIIIPSNAAKVKH
jgi:hypothetical protein